MQTIQLKFRRFLNLKNIDVYKEVWNWICVLMFSFPLVSCHTMSVPQPKIAATESYPLKTEHSNLFVAVHPVTDKTENEETFRMNLLDKGILPLLIVIENRNPSTSFILAKNKIVLVNSGSGMPLKPKREKVTSETSGVIMALIGSLTLSPPLLFPGLKIISDAQIIEHNLSDKEFYSRTLDPGQKTHGYIYFQAPHVNATMNKYYVVVEALDSSTGEAIKFNFTISLNSH
jgi:hypothetical protein